MRDEFESDETVDIDPKLSGFNLTRRDWMLSVGSAAVGFTGTGEVIAADTNQGSQLPLGLYRPSTDHLSHVLTPADFRSIPAGCPTDYVSPPSGPFKPQFFSPEEFAVIGQITALLLGEDPADAAQQQSSGVVAEVAEWVDLVVFSSADVREAARHLDPLHRSLAAAYYGGNVVSEQETADPQKICREGLEWISGKARATHSMEFLSLPVENQIAILDEISDSRHDRSVANAGTRFFSLLKTEVTRGFYTSKTGLKELDYKGNGYYARSPGCDRSVVSLVKREML